MNTLNKKNREELSLLLPWYANGTLNEEDSRKVEEAIERDEMLAAEFELILEDQLAVVDLVAEEEVPASMSERFKVAFNSEIEASNASSSSKAREPNESLVRQIVSLLFPTRPVAFAAVAAAIVLCIQSVVIFSMITSDPQTNQYQTASGGDENIVSGPGLLVKVRMAVTIDELQDFLEKNKGQIVKGPNADGMYELRFGGQGNDSEPIADIAAKAGIFEFALPMQ